MVVEKEYYWTGPLPSVVNETAPFWDACNDGKFLVQKCKDCAKVQYHYRAMCSHCWSDEIEDLPILGVGRVWTFSVVKVNRSPQFSEWGEYATGVIELPEGVKIISRIMTENLDLLQIGDEVKLAFAESETGQHIPIFVTVG